MKTLILSILLAIAVYFAPIRAVDSAARALVPAIALMATGIFPCMSLAVGSMKGEQRTPALVEELFQKLNLVLKLLVVAFAVAVISILALACTVSLAAVVLASKPADVDLRAVMGTHAAASASCFLLVMLAGRIVDLGRSFFIILDINKKHALLIARSKASIEREGAFASLRASPIAADESAPRPLKRA